MESDSIDFLPWLEAFHKLPWHQITQKEAAARFVQASSENVKRLLATQALCEASFLERNKLESRFIGRMQSLDLILPCLFYPKEKSSCSSACAALGADATTSGLSSFKTLNSMSLLHIFSDAGTRGWGRWSVVVWGLQNHPEQCPVSYQLCSSVWECLNIGTDNLFSTNICVKKHWCLQKTK